MAFRAICLAGASGTALATTPAMDVTPQARPEWRRLAELIAQIEIAMLVTADPDGSLRSRPLRVLQIGEMDEHRRVSLSYMHPATERYVRASASLKSHVALTGALPARASSIEEAQRASRTACESNPREHRGKGPRGNHTSLPKKCGESTLDRALEAGDDASRATMRDAPAMRARAAHRAAR